MKTAEEIITYIEGELKYSYERHDEAKGQDAREAFIYLVKAHTLEQLLDAITK